MSASSPPEGVRLERDGHLATVTLSAPERGNSLDGPLLLRLEQVLRELPADVRVVLLRGEGPRAFSTGYHLPTLLAELSQGESVVDFEGHPLERALRALEDVPVPTLAVIRGNAWGAGCELALTCDLRLAGDDARLCLPPARLGILYSLTGLQRLVDLVGPGLAREMIYTAEPVEAERALAAGLVDRVFPAADLERAARELAERIARNEPLSLRHHKALFRRLAPPAPGQAELREVAALRLECFKNPEFLRRAGAAAGSREARAGGAQGAVDHAPPSG